MWRGHHPGSEEGGPVRRYARLLQRRWKRLLLLSLLGIVIGTVEVILLRRWYGIPSLQAFLAVAILLAIGDFLFALGVERTTRREGPELWNSLVGRHGEVISPIGSAPGLEGRVRVAGEIWKARGRKGAGVVPPGEKVLVTARDRLVLEVEPDSKVLAGDRRRE